MDFLILIFLQFGSLFALLQPLASHRPIAMVYEIDRFRIVANSDISTLELQFLPDWARPWSWSTPRVMGIQPSQSLADLAESISLSSKGIEISQRPSRWRPIDENLTTIKISAKKNGPIRNLKAKNADQMKDLDWLPIYTQNEQSWVAAINRSTGRVDGMYDVDADKYFNLRGL